MRAVSVGIGQSTSAYRWTTAEVRLDKRHITRVQRLSVFNWPSPTACGARGARLLLPKMPDRAILAPQPRESGNVG
jgi:hypothetical protein